MNQKLLVVVATTFALILTACGKKDEPPPPPPPAAAPAPAPEPPPPPPPPPAPEGVSMSTFNLGNAIDADKRVAQALDAFGKKDTIYASVETTGTGKATLKARWTYHKGDKETLVKEDSQTIETTGPATSEFHISKPKGWPAGDYKVEIFVDDKSVGSKTFTVK